MTEAISHTNLLPCLDIRVSFKLMEESTTDNAGKLKESLDAQVLDALKTKGIAIRVASPKLVMEEAPESYKVYSRKFGSAMHNLFPGPANSSNHASRVHYLAACLGLLIIIWRLLKIKWQMCMSSLTLPV